MPEPHRDPLPEGLPGRWKMIRVCIYPSTTDGPPRVAVSLSRHGHDRAVLELMEHLALPADSELRTPEDIYQAIMQVLHPGR